MTQELPHSLQLYRVRLTQLVRRHISSLVCHELEVSFCHGTACPSRFIEDTCSAPRIHTPALPCLLVHTVGVEPTTRAPCPVLSLRSAWQVTATLPNSCEKLGKGISANLKRGKRVPETVAVDGVGAIGHRCEPALSSSILLLASVASNTAPVPAGPSRGSEAQGAHDGSMGIRGWCAGLRRRSSLP